MDNKENVIIKYIRREIAAWSNRVEIAESVGNETMLQESLKHKQKYEERLKHLEELIELVNDVCHKDQQ